MQSLESGHFKGYALDQTTKRCQKKSDYQPEDRQPAGITENSVRLSRQQIGILICLQTREIRRKPGKLYALFERCAHLRNGQ